MAIPFTNWVIHSTIGDLVVLVYQTSGNASLIMDPGSYDAGDVLESSICACPTRDPDFTGRTCNTFYLIGKSGTQYEVRKNNTVMNLYSNGQFINTLYSYSDSGGNSTYSFPIFAINELGYGINTSSGSIILSNDPSVYTITYTQVEAGKAGYSIVTYAVNSAFTFVCSIYGSGTVYDTIKDILEGGYPYNKNDDPYNRVGESNTGGGDGDGDDSSDDVEIPELPPDFASDSKFITLFNPSLAQLQSLATYMWSSNFDLSTFKKLFADPMDCILGLSIVPVAVPNGGSKTVTVGNISTGVTMTVAASQFVEVDCGSINVKEYWGAYLDYEPFTKAEIYLPYIGTHAISVDDIMGKTVHVVYHVDILSGACTAYVECGGTVIYQFIGQCAASIPISGRDFTNMINGVLSIAGSIGSMVATGGASAPLAVGAIASASVNAIKPNIEKSGSMSGTGGLMAVQTPYLILTRPRQAIPARQNSYMGYPAFITVSLDDLEGYTEVEHVHLENMSATSNEIAEIESLLKNGVIF